MVLQCIFVCVKTTNWNAWVATIVRGSFADIQKNEMVLLQKCAQARLTVCGVSAKCVYRHLKNTEMLMCHLRRWQWRWCTGNKDLAHALGKAIAWAGRRRCTKRPRKKCTPCGIFSKRTQNLSRILGLFFGFPRSQPFSKTHSSPQWKHSFDDWTFSDFSKSARLLARFSNRRKLFVLWKYTFVLCESIPVHFESILVYFVRVYFRMFLKVYFCTLWKFTMLKVSYCTLSKYTLHENPRLAMAPIKQQGSWRIGLPAFGWTWLLALVLGTFSILTHAMWYQSYANTTPAINTLAPWFGKKSCHFWPKCL